MVRPWTCGLSPGLLLRNMIARRVSSRRSSLSQGLRVRLHLVYGAVLALSVGAPTQAAQAAKKELPSKKESSKAHVDARELQAREAFVAGRYREALDLYAKLYAENLHPTYLRNIGRCHQHMGEAEEAILSFRDYLRKAPGLTSSERGEVDGFIKEMEALRDKQRLAQQQGQQKDKPVAAAPTTGAPTATGQQPVGYPMPAAASSSGAVSVVPVGANLSTAPAPEASPPVYKRAWFWGAVGTAVAVGVVGALWAGGVFSKSSNCPSGYVCP